MFEDYAYLYTMGNDFMQVNDNQHNNVTNVNGCYTNHK